MLLSEFLSAPIVRWGELRGVRISIRVTGAEAVELCRSAARTAVWVLNLDLPHREVGDSFCGSYLSPRTSRCASVYPTLIYNVGEEGPEGSLQKQAGFWIR
ncbi:MAG: hypothetical protein A2Y38_08025 [Spirochaetes bacterium GWB1_59_5]|nr:MAG: hypothetical protein A2Y38_08025 [Spirochaetes bacterium GWB1_59_5]